MMNDCSNGTISFWLHRCYVSLLEQRGIYFLVRNQSDSIIICFTVSRTNTCFGLGLISTLYCTSVLLEVMHRKYFRLQLQLKCTNNVTFLCDICQMAKLISRKSCAESASRDLVWCRLNRNIDICTTSLST